MSRHRPRNVLHFPDMNDRAGRRRFRRTIARVQRFCDHMNRMWEAGVVSESAYRAEAGIEPPYDHGGLIEPGWTLVTLDVAECVITAASLQEGTLRCGRADEAHRNAVHHGRPCA